METLKKIWKWLKWVVLATLGALGFMIGKKIINDRIIQIGKVEKPKNWLRLPGDNKTIGIFGSYGQIEHYVPLPINPTTKKRVTTPEIAAVGVSEDGGKINVEIKHNPVDRSGR
jgi:hypothetical protein